MASEIELLRAGVAALQSGNREGAIQALSQVVDMNPYNEQAWFYLAAADVDPQMRKRYLERVLELNPSNAKARDILDKLIAKEKSAIPVRSQPSNPSATLTPPVMPPVKLPTPQEQTPPPAEQSSWSGSSFGETSFDSASDQPQVDSPARSTDSTPSRQTPLQARLNRSRSSETAAPPPPAEPEIPPASSPIESWDAPPAFVTWDDPYTSTKTVNADEYASDANTASSDEELPDLGSFAPLRRNSSARAAKVAASEGDDELLSRITGTGEVPRAKSAAAPKVSLSSTIRPLAPDAGSLLGAASGDSGFALPFDIPGAPARMSVGSLLRGGVALLRGGMRIVTRRPQAYSNEIERATWWRFVLYSIFVGLIQTVMLAITLWIVDGRITTAMRLAGIDRMFNVASGFVMLLLGVPFYIACLMGGSAIGWTVVRQVLKVNTSYLKFLYAVSVVWLPLSLAATFLAFLFNALSLIPVGYYSLLAILSSIGLAVYAGYSLYDAVRHFEGDIMMDEKERRRHRIAAGSAIMGIFLLRLLIGIVLTAMTGSTVLVFLFT